jgi:hypothetical protein
LHGFAVIRADQAESFADEVQARSGGLDADGLNGVRLVDDSGDPVQDRVRQTVMIEQRMKRAMPTVVGVLNPWDVERFGVLGDGTAAGYEDELRLRVNLPQD